MQQPRNFSLHGAVDLGARQAAAQRRQAPRAQPPGGAADGEQPDSPGGYVIDVTDETFNDDVVARSREVPVILDLWAEWCGPCKQLSPVLEKLADEAAGAWILAKVDVDANPQLSAALQVQSIPMVVAVIGGQVADGFLGAMPEAQVRAWLSQVMGVAEQIGVAAPAQAAGAQGAPAGAGQPAAAAPPGGPAGARPGPGGPGGPGRPGSQPGDPRDDPALAEAQRAMERGDIDAAVAVFERMLATAPGHPVATMGLAQAELIRRVNSYDQAKVAREASEHPLEVAAQAAMADVDVAMGRPDAGFGRLLDVVRRSAGDERNRARLHLVGLFEVFPPRDPRVTKARATLSSLLF